VAFFSRVSQVTYLASMIMAAGAPAAFAQNSPGYFIPPAGGQPAGGQPAGGQSAPVHHQAAPAQAPMGAATAAADAAAAQAQPQLPPIPQLPALPKEPPPPAAVIGVLSVPDVLQKSTAAQGVQAIIQARRAKLAAEAQKDQQGWQNQQAAITAQRGKLTDAQLEAKEKGLQDQIAAAQTDFRARDQAIQNSAQAALGQIEAELIAVIRQVAEARGMNLVLHREQVALNVNAFDITADVATELNKLLPSVSVPPSVVTPGMPIDTPQDQGGGGQGDGQ
jgi:Skp family chaperone for outer membrane proteins